MPEISGPFLITYYFHKNVITCASPVD